MKHHTPKQEPKLLDMETMKEIIMPHSKQISDYVFFNNEIGILHGNPNVFRLITQQKAPFTINDHRLGFVVRGEGLTNLNLVDCHIRAGMFVYLAPGTIINPISFSDDLEIFGIALFSDFIIPFPQNKIPLAFNGQQRDFQLSVSENEILTARRILDALWHVVHQPDYSRPVVSSLVAALIHHYNDNYRRNSEHHLSARSHEQTIFDRFILLVNKHCHEQHHIGYYAGRMCLTERYLSTTIRKTSGVTAKEWIDRALITRIKIELMHTEKSIANIADDLHFPNPSFFCKYFKRLVGITAGEYRMG
ncbi:MAG: helix-turn-helix transcriptional regulator [Prevotella sp.]